MCVCRCAWGMMFGGATNERVAACIVARAGEQGLNFIDTADGYNGGRSEEVCGRANRGDGSRWEAYAGASHAG